VVKCVIQHHPRRAERIPALLAALDREAEVVTDPSPGMDKTNSWTTYQLCLRRAPASGHLLILQDDVEPCQNLLAACDVIAAQTKDALVCLWHGKQPVRGAVTYQVAKQHRVRYAQIRPQPWPPLVAALWPADLARRFLAWHQLHQTRLPRGLRADDGVAARFLSVNRVRMWATVPSLVEHPDIDSIRKKPRGRLALWYIGDTDPLTLDWTLDARAILTGRTR
jgi:hypothetical protein